MTDIPNYEIFTKIEPLNKGWSSDKKFYIETRSGERRLLRVADVAEYERKRTEFDMLRRVAELGVPASRPVDFGMCDGGKSVYQLLTWIDGEDAETVLPTLSEAEQYALGIKAGELLQKIHSIPAPDGIEEWLVRFRRKICGHLSGYNVQSEICEQAIRYLNENERLLERRPQTFNHGDYNPTNIILKPDGTLSAIDFCFVYGDPYWDFCAIPVGKDANPHYQTGLINGYFGSNPPEDLFPVLAYYFATDVLTRVSPDDEPEKYDIECLHIKNILRWFDNFNRVVPSWYLQDKAGN
ncbi:MAG: phosphotransferase [Oscillospiraceae bacterium]|nr:phosphotransferase [Oscillospiraceae bacterium]